MSDPKTKQVTAVLYPVAQSIHAKPGQHIMVVAGVVVGIYTGDDVVPVVATSLPLTAKPPTKKGAAIAHRPSVQKHNKRYKKDGTPVSTVVPVIRCIAAMLHTRSDDWFASSDIVKEMQKRGVDTVDWRIRDAVQWLKNNGWIEVTGRTALTRYRRGQALPTQKEISDMWSGIE